MDPRSIQKFEAIIRSGKHPQFACFQLSTSQLVKCTMCDSQLNFVDVHHLHQHLKSNKHKMQALIMQNNDQQSILKQIKQDTSYIVARLDYNHIDLHPPAQHHSIQSPLDIVNKTQLNIDNQIVQPTIVDDFQQNNEINIQSPPIYRQDDNSDKLFWFKEIDSMYKNTSTGSEYMRYNKAFQKWFSKNYGKAKVLERHAREYVSSYIEAGKSTQTLIAALKFRFNYCERLGFNFKGLLKQSESLNSHKYLSAEEIQSIDQSLSNNLPMQVACRLLYDLAARCQDLLQFKYNMFIPNGDGATIEFIPKKTMKSKVTRSGVITKETLDLLKKLQLLTYASSDEFIYKQTEKQLKNRFYKLFKMKLKIQVQSHDFRHSRITDLFKQNMSVNAIQKYVGHLQTSTTQRYINIDKDEALEQVKNLSTGPLTKQRDCLEEEKQVIGNDEEEKSEDELPQSITLKVIRQKKRRGKRANQMTLHDLMAFTQIAEVFEKRHEAGKRQKK